MKNLIRIMQIIGGCVLIIGGVCAGAYISGWLMIVVPLLDIYKAVSGGYYVFTLGLVAMVKILLSGTVCFFVTGLTTSVGVYCIRSGLTDQE